MMICVKDVGAKVLGVRQVLEVLVLRVLVLKVLVLKVLVLKVLKVLTAGMRLARMTA